MAVSSFVGASFSQTVIMAVSSTMLTSTPMTSTIAHGAAATSNDDPTAASNGDHSPPSAVCSLL